VDGETLLATMILLEGFFISAGHGAAIPRVGKGTGCGIHTLTGLSAAFGCR